MSDTISNRAAHVRSTLQAERNKAAGSLRDAKVINEAELRAFVAAVDVSAQLEKAKDVVMIVRTALPTAGQEEYDFFKSRGGAGNVWRPDGKAAKGWTQAIALEAEARDLVSSLKREKAFRRFDDAARAAGESGLIPQSLAHRLRDGVIRSAPALELASLRDTAHNAGRGKEYDALVRSALDYCEVQRLSFTELIGEGIVPGAFEAKLAASMMIELARSLFFVSLYEGDLTYATPEPRAISVQRPRHAGEKALADALAVRAPQVTTP